MDFIRLEPFPFEYYLKNNTFSEQSELRIIIASTNKQFYENLKGNNNSLSIGDISSFSIVQNKYSSDLLFSIQGDKLIYSLANPVTLTLEQREFEELLGELYQIMQNRLPGKPRKQEELKLLAKPIIDHLKQKYGVEFRDDWRLYNVPYDAFIRLPKLYQGMCVNVKM